MIIFRSKLGQHAGQDLQAKVFFIAQPIGSALDDTDFVVQTFVCFRQACGTPRIGYLGGSGPALSCPRVAWQFQGIQSRQGSRRAPRHDAVRRPDSRTARCDSVRQPRYSAILCVFRTQTASFQLRMRLVSVHRRGRQDPDIAAGSLRMPRKVLAPACFVSGSIHEFNLKIVTISGGYYDECTRCGPVRCSRTCSGPLPAVQIRNEKSA